MPVDFDAAFAEARNLHASGKLLEAERIYRGLASPGERRHIALQALSELYLQQRRLDEAHHTLRALTTENPDSLHHCGRLAYFLDTVGQTQAAIDEYLRLLQRQPDIAVAHYNLALLYAKLRKRSDALSAYENAIRLDIDKVEEVYSNMGVLYSDMHEPDKAREMYERALDAAPRYTPAMYNLAGHFEEADEKQQAIDLYERILSIDPGHFNSLARLAYPRTITSEDGELITRIQSGIEQAQDDDMACESLYFALGKAFDDLQQYDDASAAYVAANELGKKRGAPYDRGVTEKAFDGLIEMFDADWVKTVATASEAAPVFICGMLRSGSTLVEQMLAAHPSVTAGGEIDVLPWLIGHDLAPFPQGVRDASRERLQQVADEYLSRVRSLFPDGDRITDKRPDNFLHLGLIKALFPRAKIVFTRRNALDNCLSMYFLQLAGNLSYAMDLGDAAHYRQQHDRLMAHWSMCFGADIFAIDYETLVQTPEPIMRKLTDFLDLPWDDRVLEFHERSGHVKTASLWQVRQALHTRSVGRSRNYQALLEGVPGLLPDNTVP